MLMPTQKRRSYRYCCRLFLKRSLLFQLVRGVCTERSSFLQAELAALMCTKSRLVRTSSADGRYSFGSGGEAEVVSARG